MKHLLILSFLLFAATCAYTQASFSQRATSQSAFTRADSLRGALRPERTCYDVTFYDLDIKVDPSTHKIEGSNSIYFNVNQDFKRIQLDLFENMAIDAVLWKDEELPYQRDGDAFFVDFPATVKAGSREALKIKYSGVPTEAKRAPWDGGFVWKKDGNGKHWVGVACEGTGASLWWPCKDHLGDEPDSLRIAVTAPAGLKAVCNGNLRSVRDIDPQWSRWEWFVSYPINSYNVTVNIADYAHIHDTYTNETGDHDLDYYVLVANEAKAREQFKQVKPMLAVFEQYFGDYPFWKDGYALVETPYLGMEHQGAIAYGNHYRPGYDGYDPLNLKFDYIVIHESGHEWWGNSVSCSDHAELWIHEGFCTYSEAVYVEALWDRPMAERYLMSQRGNIVNQDAIVGPLDVNFNNWAGSDMYYKGAWMLHTLRNAVNDDALWWKTLRSFAIDFRIKNTNTNEVIAYFNQKLGKDYTWLFDEYLRHAKPPILAYKLKKKGTATEVTCHWIAANADFALPVTAYTKTASVRLPVTTTPQKFKVDVPIDQFKFDYVSWYGLTKDLNKAKK
jgi:aminopeptidase N